MIKKLSCALGFATFAFSSAVMAQGTTQSVPLAKTDEVARAAHRPISPRKIILVGDSTVQVNSGWGGEFCAKHLSANVQCVNLARGGRSSFSFRAEGSWQLALNEMKTPGYVKTYVLIQFGHNDMLGKPGRSADLASEYPEFMRQYVRETISAGAIPILVTPLTRRSFKDGKLKNDLLPWAETLRRIALEEKVPLLDLNAASALAVEAMGARESLNLAQMPPSEELIQAALTGTTIDAPKPIAPANPQNCNTAPSTQNCITSPEKPIGIPSASVNRSFDYTHIGESGAKYFSAMVAVELAKSVPELSEYLIP